MTNPHNDQKGFRFQPTLSFDGVAILVGVIIAAAAWGSLRTTVDAQGKRMDALEPTVAAHGQQIAVHESRLNEMAGQGRRLDSKP